MMYPGEYAPGFLIYKLMDEILTGKVCPYCGKPTEFVDSSVIYGRSYGMIWKKHIPNTSNRNKAYLWLSSQLGIPHEVCHIGMFDVDNCKRVIELCKPICETYVKA